MTSAQASLKPISITLPDGRSGRAFVKSDVTHVTDDLLQDELLGAFVDDDDDERLALLESAFDARTVQLDTFPSTTDPVVLHAYVRAPDISSAPIFACVLAPAHVVRALIAQPPYVVFETATFQCVDGDGPLSGPNVVRAIETWARRMWPQKRIGTVVVRPWVEREGMDAEPGPLLGLRAA